MYTQEQIEAQKVNVELARRNMIRLQTIWENASMIDRIVKGHTREYKSGIELYQMETQRLNEMIGSVYVGDNTEVVKPLASGYLVPVIVLVLVVGIVVYIKFLRK